ncbi:MAG: DUF4190 domain-containing protein [Treponema sp.]|nr:DUF4190 domain-containing protein [Treponema sp.]
MDDQFQDNQSNQVDPWDQANQNDPWDQPSQPQDQSNQYESSSQQNDSSQENSGYQNQQPSAQPPVPQQQMTQQPVQQQPVNQYSYQNQQQVPPRPATYPGKGLSVASMVLGIIAMVCLLTGWFSFIAVVMGVVGLILGIMGKKKTPNGMATAGIVLSIIALALGALIFVSCIVCMSCIFSSTADFYPNFPDIFSDAESWNYTL